MWWLNDERQRYVSNNLVKLGSFFCCAACFLSPHRLSSCFPGGSDGKESACNSGDLGLIPGWIWFPTWVGKSPGERSGNPLQCSCLENPHGQRSLVGYGCKELDTTERLSTVQHKLLQGLEFISGMSSPVYWLILLCFVLNLSWYYLENCHFVLEFDITGLTLIHC